MRTTSNRSAPQSRPLSSPLSIAPRRGRGPRPCHRYLYPTATILSRLRVNIRLGKTRDLYAYKDLWNGLLDDQLRIERILLSTPSCVKPLFCKTLPCSCLYRPVLRRRNRATVPSYILSPRFVDLSSLYSLDLVRVFRSTRLGRFASAVQRVGDDDKFRPHIFSHSCRNHTGCTCSSLYGVPLLIHHDV